MAEKVGEVWHDSRELDAYDVGFTLAISPVAVPTMLVASAAVAMIDRQNPFFMQERVGNGRSIHVPKFTTLPDVYEEMPRHGGYDDPRASTVGAFLRKTHIDELPQGLLILNRKMSLVGPRPTSLPHEKQIRSELNTLEVERRKYTFQTCRPGLAMDYSMSQHFGHGDIDPGSRAWADYQWAMYGSRSEYFKVLRNNALTVAADLADLDVEARSGHSQTVAGFEHIAKHFGVQITEDDHAYWRSMLTVSRALDIHVDDEKVTSVDQLFDDILNGQPIKHMTGEECEEFKRVFWAQLPEKQDAILDGKSMLQLAHDLKNASSVKEIIHHRHKEAILFADILALPVAAGMEDTTQREAFNEWLRQFSKAGFILDTLLDQSVDYAQGNSTVRPSVATSFILAKTAFVDLRRTYKDLPNEAIPGMVVTGISKFIRDTLTPTH